MSDYNKQTVANLRQLLKDRGIPSTGLTRKAQIIEKLEEWDSKSEPEAAAPEEDGEEEAPGVAQPEATPTVDEAKAGEPGEGTLRFLSLLTRNRVATNPSAERAPKKSPSPEPAPAAVSQDEVPPPKDSTPSLDTPAAERTFKDKGPIATEEVDAQEAPATVPEPVADTAQSEPAATDVQGAERTPSPSPDEQPSVEKPELETIAERSTTATADPSRLNSEELEAETRKRKRRSQTPELPSQDIRVKRPRPSDEGAPDVRLKEDEDTVMEQRQPEKEEKEVGQETMDKATNGYDASEVRDPSKDDGPEEQSALEKKEKVPRYRELFQHAAEAKSTEAIQDDRPIVPALHVVTSAIYIRNFMRPLRPEPLRAHLVSLASPPGSSPDPTIVKSLFLDAMKTHALVILSDTKAASRVRASLQGSIWPPEGNRKELWVDFIPEDKAEGWIREEEDAITAEKDARAAGRPIPAKKFEVVYPEDESGAVTAVFQEVGAGAAAFNPPKGPRRPSEQVFNAPAAPKHSAPTQETRQGIEKSFKTLDELFLCTTAKPQLYYLPVTDDRSELRLKELDLETSRDWTPEERRRGRGIQTSRMDQKVRFGFDDEDRIIEVGGDFGPWTEDFRGGPRGGFRGGFRGGRGRGGGWRSGPSGPA